jgi:aminodeoxyfutalosine deaminase
MSVPPEPKIELHVHLEGAVRPVTLLEIARRNDLPLPGSTVEELEALYQFRDMDQFVVTWFMTTSVLHTRDDFRQILVDYAGEAAGHGAVYVEAIFSPIGQVMRGVPWDEIFAGYCEGIELAREQHGVHFLLTPDIHRGATREAACETARRSVKWRDRGIVGFGIGGNEAWTSDEIYAEAFNIAREGGLASVPHAGEHGGAAAVRSAIDTLGADRIRHGIGAAEDAELVAELIERGMVLDVCPVSNVATGAVSSLAEHPLAQLAEAGVACSISTDDPAMFSTDLTHEYAVAADLGVSAAAAYRAGLQGALCDGELREELSRVGRKAGYIA